jgi:hypothetical protein
MNKSEKKTIGALGLIVLVFLGAAQMGYLKQWGIGPLLSQTGTNPPPDNTGSTYDNYALGVGKFELDWTCFDSADPATTRDFGTILDAFAYHFSGGQWVPEAGAYVPGSTNYFDAKTGDNGFMYIALKPHALAGYYVDYQKIIGIPNSYISGYQYVDVDNDGAKEFVFQYNLKSHTIPNSGYPILSFTSYAMTYEAMPSLGVPANLTGISTAVITKYVEWYTSVTTAKKGYAMYKVEVKATTTDETRVRLKKLQVPGYGNLDVSEFTKTFTSTDIRWTKTFSTGFDGADYLVRMPNDANKYYMTAQLEFLLPSGNVDMTLTVYYLIGGTEAGASVTSTLNCAS